MPSTIIILTGNHLCHNPRVQKEAATLAARGHKVKVLGGWLDLRLKQRDDALIGTLPFEFIPVEDLTARRAAKIRSRTTRKLGTVVYRGLGLDNKWQLGSTYPALQRAAWNGYADLYIAHSEAALAVVAGLSRAGYRIGVDMEDWFSEDLLPEARRGRPVKLLRRQESEVLANSAFATCPSRAMSLALAEEFGCPPPAVVYNAFPWAERALLDGRIKDRDDCRHPSIHWFSQTIGPGRGLEDLFAALPLLKHPAALHLRGKPVAGFEEWLAKWLPGAWRSHVFLHDVVSNAELLSRITEHNIGFAGEMKYCRSRDLTVTNKILQYLLAGLAVVASDTEGQREVAKRASEAVLLYPSGTPQALAARLDELLGEPERLERARLAALRAAREVFCWERQEPTLLDAVGRALARPPAAGG
ncbi:MAG TPA: glycosyltransferase [Xanthobacteraceae bacterium]|nr:glycosyltransferase [Xanthobacteraceae bacterium]